MNPDDIDTRPIRKPAALDEIGEPDAPPILDWVQERERRHRSRRIERYVRHTERLMYGSIDLGLHYESDPDLHRRALQSVTEAIAEQHGTRKLDAAAADEITRDLDERLVALCGDVPRFIEIWTDGDEPLTQWYAPHRVPVTR
jgi:hypothetical protein